MSGETNKYQVTVKKENQSEFERLIYLKLQKAKEAIKEFENELHKTHAKILDSYQKAQPN